MNSTPLELILHDKVQQLLDNFASVMSEKSLFRRSILGIGSLRHGGDALQTLVAGLEEFFG